MAVVFEGTGIKNIRDWIADVSQLAGIPLQCVRAVKYARGPLPRQGATMVLLTDGRDESGSSWDGEAGFIPAGVVVHTIALSGQADLEALSRLSAATGGVPEIARNAGELQATISTLSGMAEGDEVLLVRKGNIHQGKTAKYVVDFEEGIGRVNFQVSWPGSVLISRSLIRLAAVLGGESGETVYTMRPMITGLYRVHVEAAGIMDDGSRVQRAFERTFRVAVPGRGVKRKHRIKPFIRSY